MTGLRRHPYRLLFPLGIALSWVGVGHWALHAWGLLADYRPRFHAVVQTQGFMTCLALGFLFTMIPRRTETEPPSAGELAIGAGAPVGVVVAAGLEAWAAAQLFWLAAVLVLVRFIALRFRGPGESRRPNGFVWIPASLAIGLVGALLGLAVEFGLAGPLADRVARGLTQQGFLVALVLGVGGSLALPLMTRGEPPPPSRSARHDRLARAAHATGALLLALSFWVEARHSLALAMALRAAVATGVLLFAARMWRPPNRTGANACIVWLAAWLLPAGFALAALRPDVHRAGLHVAFLGGFALLGMAVGAQVLLGHGGYTRRVRGWPASALVLLTAALGAILLRVIQEIDRARFFGWMGGAAVLFLLATGAWLRYVWPALAHPRDAS